MRTAGRHKPGDIIEVGELRVHITSQRCEEWRVSLTVGEPGALTCIQWSALAIIKHCDDVHKVLDILSECMTDVELPLDGEGEPK